MRMLSVAASAFVMLGGLLSRQGLAAAASLSTRTLRINRMATSTAISARLVFKTAGAGARQRER